VCLSPDHGPLLSRVFEGVFKIERVFEIEGVFEMACAYDLPPSSDWSE